MNEQRNLILAIVLSVAIVLVFEFLYQRPIRELDRLREQQTAATTAPAAQAPGAAPVGSPTPVLPGTPPASPQSAAPRPAPEIAPAPRVRITSSRLTGSLSLRGGRIDDLAMVDYRETPDPRSAPIVLLSRAGAAGAYYADFGWSAVDASVPVPTPDTVWRADRNDLSPDSPVTLTWDNGQGQRFTQRYELDRNYIFTVTQRVENTGATPVTLHPFGLVVRSGTPVTSGYYILHEGPVGVFNDVLKEVSYEDLRAKPILEQTTGGWIGITDKYWLVALAPNQKTETRARFSHGLNAGVDQYQVDVIDAAARTAAPGGAIEESTRLFAGAKEVKLLDEYTASLNIARLDLAVDWGWFPFLTRPIFYVLEEFKAWIGNFGLAILLLTLIIKLAFFPLANKSYRAMSKMKSMQPEMTKLRERYADDKQRMNQELMALYKRQGANPLAGCLPIVIQIPVFFALYKVLFVTIEMRHAPFYGWIHDLSAADPTSLFNLFGLIPWTPPELLHVGAWPLIMGITMFLQMKLNPQPPDPIQAKVFMLMPVIFTVILAPFPAGLVIYWAWNNVLSVLQQWLIMRQTAAASTPEAPTKPPPKK